MSDERWTNEGLMWILKLRLVEHMEFADRVHLIQRLLKLAIEVLDGMEAEAAREHP